MPDLRHSVRPILSWLICPGARNASEGDVEPFLVRDVDMNSTHKRSLSSSILPPSSLKRAMVVYELSGSRICVVICVGLFIATHSTAIHRSKGEVRISVLIRCDTPAFG